MTSPWILPLQSAQAASVEDGLALVGGKSANLARMARAGFPVPDGFLITTQAYRDFIRSNQFEEMLQAALPAGGETDAAVLEAASDTIRGLFSSGRLPAALAEALAAAYLGMGSPAAAVAVRSSATAEDLPEMSFAGQQDTFLNVRGVEALNQAVIDCWSSLWTARAIGYRIRNHVPHTGIALGVVVQHMVESQASGVLFTANPLTGLRTQTVIDATFGLGEALVSGQVEPDHYVVDTARWRLVEKTLGSKAVSIHGQLDGGTLKREEPRKDRQAISDDQILALAKLGQQVAANYGTPQDIEWAMAENTLYLLQTRAITSLFPTPEELPSEPLKVLCSFGAVQGLLDPITPLGQDMIKMFFTAGMALYGIRATSDTQKILYSSGERLWINITTIVRNSVGRRVAQTALGMVEPTILQSLLTIWEEAALQPDHLGIHPRSVRMLARVILPMAGNLLKNMHSPQKRRAYIVARGESLLETIGTRTAAITGAPRDRLAEVLHLQYQMVKEQLPKLLILFISGVATGMASLNFVRQLTRGLPARSGSRSWADEVLELTRGVPHNPTTEMDLALWEIAHTIQGSPELTAEFHAADSHSLASQYQSGRMSQEGRALIRKFLDRYGGRGLGEIDLGRPRWNDDPAHVFDVLSSYLEITDPNQAPDVVFARSEAAAQTALEQICAALRKTRGGWWKERRARFFANRMRQMMGLRENPKFFLVRLMGLFRSSLLEIGADLVRAGDLEKPDDLNYLTLRELDAFATSEPVDWKNLIAARRETQRREALRRQIPRLLLSDGRAFYEGIIDASAEQDTLSGSPVSPGSADGMVRVVFNPRQANLKPGEILVCPGTDPSWTPLFLTASGLVMEVGGMMTHGAVVAREYGIPAIVGVDQATLRLKTGQRIRIDGSSGVIQLFENHPEA